MTQDMGHMTHDMRQVTNDMWWEVNLLSKCQIPSSHTDTHLLSGGFQK